MELVRVIHSNAQQFTEKKKSPKRKEDRPMTDFSAAHNGNVNGKEDGNDTNKKPDVSTCLKYRTFLFVLDSLKRRLDGVRPRCYTEPHGIAGTAPGRSEG
jgi:predicted glutamine amidotransferase